MDVSLILVKETKEYCSYSSAFEQCILVLQQERSASSPMHWVIYYSVDYTGSTNSTDWVARSHVKAVSIVRHNDKVAPKRVQLDCKDISNRTLVCLAAKDSTRMDTTKGTLSNRHNAATSLTSNSNIRVQAAFRARFGW